MPVYAHSVHGASLRVDDACWGSKLLVWEVQAIIKVAVYGKAVGVAQGSSQWHTSRWHARVYYKELSTGSPRERWVGEG
jgi:hypothetical protein